MNPLLDAAAIGEFLGNFSSKTRRRGMEYYAIGAVKQTSCVEPGSRYAAKVRGTEDYEVVFDFDSESESWDAKCSCPMMYDCKHAYAGMLALQANAARFSNGVPTVHNAGVVRPAAPKKSPAPRREEPQPSSSPLAVALTKAVGRKLNRTEVPYVIRVQLAFSEALRHGMRMELLRQLAPAVQEYGWAALDLWPKAPRNDLEFWLYCAWEIRRRKLPIPEFMEPVTDFKEIEPAMAAWEREKSIAHWRATLEYSVANMAAGIDTVDFRLMILPHEARVQWRNADETEFKDLKQTHLRRFDESFQGGRMAVIPEAMPLWLAIYRPHDSYTACNFSFDRTETARMLNQALRLPGIADRIVTAEAVPLARPEEPLRYDLQPAKDETGDYLIRLVQPDGSTPPPILLTLPGKPALYLTPEALYRGPAPHGSGGGEALLIPAPALESAPGVNFLEKLNLEMPPRLAQRTRRVIRKVQLKCELKPIYPSSETDAVFFEVTTKTEFGEVEQLAHDGWYLPERYGSITRKQPPTELPDGTIPIVDRSAQALFPGIFESLGGKWDGYSGSWRIKLTKAFPELFIRWLQALPSDVEVLLDRALATLRNEPVSGSVRLDVEEKDVDWFDLKIVLNVTDTSLTQDELKLLLNARGGFVRLGKKGWRRLQFNLSPEEDERLARIGLDARDFTAEPQRLHALQLADDAARKLLPEQQAERIQRRVGELKTRVTPPLPVGISAQLRPYQIEGFHFLAYLTVNRFGGVLADDMGLGKTLQTLTWLAWLREQSSGEAAHPIPEAPAKKARSKAKPARSGCLPSLVVCPKSVMDNWRAEAERFFPGLRVRLWRGEDATVLATARTEADLIVLNYAQLRSLSPEISECQWLAVILDEAQAIKNPESQTAQTARMLKAAHRLALTGTPIENRLLDLWSIFSFAMPGVLGNRAQFVRRFNQQDDPLARRRLAARVRPFLIRRAKSEVAKDLPDRVEEDLICELEGEQKTLYRAEFKRAQQMLLKVKTQQELNEQRFNFLTSLLRLRQICCHPALVSAELGNAESAKVNALLDLLEPLMEEGHKVLVFSQFVSMLDILSKTIKDRGWAQFYLAGDTENRGELVKEFQGSQGAGVFLISLKAGGFGLNLTAASYVVLFDPWWNPAVENQAIDRTHRIGQTSKVIAYRLLMKDSIEQKIRALQRTKAALADDVLGEEKFSQSLTLDDLRFLFTEE